MTCYCKKSIGSTGFSIDHYRDEYKINFRFLQRFKFTDLLECNDCGCKWLLDKSSKNSFAYKLFTQSQFRHLEEWNNHSLSAKNLKNKTDKIGYDNFFEIPCKAKLKGGIQLDFCILSKSSFHPAISWFDFPIKNILYVNNLESIEASDYGLSLKHRISINSAHEISNSFAPVNLMINEDLYFRYEGNIKFFNSFFKCQNYDASSIVSTNQDIRKYNNPTIHEDLKDKLTLILCDEL